MAQVCRCVSTKPGMHIMFVASTSSASGSLIFLLTAEMLFHHQSEHKRLELSNGLVHRHNNRIPDYRLLRHNLLTRFEHGKWRPIVYTKILRTLVEFMLTSERSCVVHRRDFIAQSPAFPSVSEARRHVFKCLRRTAEFGTEALARLGAWCWSV